MPDVILYRDGAEQARRTVTFQTGATAFTSLASLQAAVPAAPPGSTLELAAGNYGTLALSGQKAAPGITIRSQVPGAAKLARINFANNSAGFSISRFDIDPTSMGIVVTPGCDRINILNNYLHDGAYLLEMVSANGSVPGAPAGNPVEAPITNCVVRGNKFARPSENAMRICNFRNVLIEENEITGVIESGAHVDGMQTFFGGDGMIYRRNYHHDNQAQQFFIKDGQAKNVLVEDNLFVRNSNLNTVSFTNILGMTVRRNTIWAARPGLVIGNWGGIGSNIVVEDNVVQHFSIDPDTSALAAAITERRNTFGGTSYPGPGGTYTGGNGNMVPNRMSTTSQINMNPTFTATATDDYRLADGSARGVSWRPAQYSYGF